MIVDDIVRDFVDAFSTAKLMRSYHYLHAVKNDYFMVFLVIEAVIT